MASGDGNVRIGTTEREEAVRALGEHLSEGRLDVTEYDQRCAQVVAAKTRADLAAVFDDLPDPHPLQPAGPTPVPVPVPAHPLIQNEQKSRTTAVVVGAAIFAVVAIVTVVAILGEWWALIPALLIIAVLAMVS
jgi:hypothetical protein